MPRALLALSATLHPGEPAGRRLIRSLLAALHLERGFHVCHIGAANGDREDFGGDTVRFFERDYGAAVSWPRLSEERIDRLEAGRALETADVVFIGGGDTIALVDHVKRHLLEPSLRRAAGRAALIFGVSAGACVLGPYTIGYDAESHGFLARCFDLGVPHPLDVHDEVNGWPESRLMIELAQREHPSEDHAALCVPTGAAALVHADGAITGVGWAPCEVRRLTASGGWAVETLRADPSVEI